MKRIYQIIFLITIALHISMTGKSQGNTWTWVSGEDTAWSPYDFNYSPPYIKSVAAPSARGYMAHWTDSSGNFWLFGGSTFNGLGNDLWKYDINANTWT